MSDDHSDRPDRSPATTSFEGWLDRQAESQGISRQELFERLVSSYWTLTELVQLLDDSGNTTSLADVYPGNGPEPPDGSGAAPTIGGSGHEPDEERERSEDRDSQSRRKQGDRDTPPEEVSELRTRIEELHDRIDGLGAEVASERERGQSQDGLIEALVGRLSGIEADLDELESAAASGRESLSSEQAALERRLDELESDLDGRQKQLASEQDRIRSRLDSEFSELETILEYLISRTDDLDAGLATVEERHDEALSQLRWEREAMRSLLRAADDHGAHVGECGVCGEDVNLGLLAEPYCSQCDSLLTGIEERDKWLFFSDVVVTAEEAPTAGGNRGAPPPNAESVEPGGSPSTSPGSGRDVGRSSSEASAATDTESRRATPTTGETEPERAAADERGEADTPEPDSGPQSDEPSEDASGPVGFAPGDADPDADPTASEGGASGFSFGASDAGSSADHGDGPGFEAESEPAADGADGAAVDAPFGDLDDLKRQEEADEK